MSSTFFVTGTDTGVGKTLITAALLHAARQQQLTTLAMKPLAAGCDATPEGLRNEDALALQANMTVELEYEQVNPVALAEPIAPHLAAALAGRRLSLDRLLGFCRGTLMNKADLRLIEGAGGWRMPLNERETLAGLPQALDIPVILVVGVRLGCLNHALLTQEAIMRDGVKIAGWVASQVEAEMPALAGNLETLRGALAAPCLGEVPFLPQPTPEAVAGYLDLSKLFSDFPTAAP
jgi:dethiobiotin synthetase